MAQEKAVRSTLGEQVRAWADDDRIKRMLDEIEGLEKRVWLDCPNCKKRSQVSVSDDVRKLEALLKVIEQVEGKPGTAGTEPGGITIVVERMWPSGDEAKDPLPQG